MPDLAPHLARQVLRSGTSIGANLEEARAAQTRRDSAARFSIALKEARETAYWLRLLSRFQKQFRQLRQQMQFERFG
jgi:four helix bundle protein